MMDESFSAESIAESELSSQTLCYRQRLEKTTGGEVILMEWSPTMDLLAAALADHSVVLNRLSWQRVWIIPSAKTSITAIAWRPDGRVLAVGHRDGWVGLHNVENGVLLNEFSTGSPTTSLYWAKMDRESQSLLEGGSSPYREVWSQYLPPLPSIENREESYPEDPKLLQPKESLKSLHVLLIGNEEGSVHVCALGVVLLAKINSSSDGGGGQVIMSRISHDFKEVFNVTLTYGQSPMHVNLQTYATSLIFLRSRELHHMTLEFGHVTYHLEYLDSVLKAMYESWDDLLFNLDNQLASYSKVLPEGKTVADEFLVLLACGKASQQLKDFLISELTAKGVKKLGLSLEHSYDNIKRLLLHHFQSSLMGLHLHLGEVLAMSRWHDRFGSLGLLESFVQKCINDVGTLSLKSQEMLQAIDHSLESIKVFFLWLYVVILKLSKEAIPKGLKEGLNPKELKLILDFLKKRLAKAKEGEHAFNLETVGQYLKKCDLKYVEEEKAGFWDKIMKDSTLDLSSIPCLYQPSPSKSLAQLFESLHKTISEAFSTPAATIQSSFTPGLTSRIDTELGKTTMEQCRSLTCSFHYNGHHYLCLPDFSNSDGGGDRASCKRITLLRLQDNNKSLEKCCFMVKNIESLTDKDANQICCILSLQFYNENTLSILFKYTFKLPEVTGSTNSTTEKDRYATHSILAQLPIMGVTSLLSCDGDKGSVAKDIGSLLTQVHNLGSFKAGKLAVGGNRKVAAVVSENGKKIRVFDVDAEEDQEE